MNTSEGIPFLRKFPVDRPVPFGFPPEKNSFSMQMARPSLPWLPRALRASNEFSTQDALEKGVAAKHCQQIWRRLLCRCPNLQHLRASFDCYLPQIALCISRLNNISFQDGFHQLKKKKCLRNT